MKGLVLLSIVIAGAAANVIKDPNAGYKEGDRFFYFPGDGDDTWHLVDTEEPVDLEFLRHYTRNTEIYNDYWLFTRANPTSNQVIEIYDTESLLNSNYDSSKVTVALAHGWNGNGNSSMNEILTEAFLRDGDVNVIVLDWSILASRSYFTAMGGVPATGRLLGQFLNWLVSLGAASYDRIHLVGHSLGGHLVGSAGRETGSLVRRITALDPAGPFWRRNSDKLAVTDAQYVEAIHTNTLFLGYRDPLGHADFYPNGGSSMPGCWLIPCSHGMSYQYMAASVTHNHLLANECASLEDSRHDNCSGDLYPMGNSDLEKSRSGIFRVNTEEDYPFYVIQ